MKKLLTLALTAAMLLTSSVTVFAEGQTGLSLADGSRLVLDRENGYVDKIDGTVTVGKLKAEFATAVDVAGKSDDAAVATDDAITAGEDSLRALIYGDVDRNGKVNLGDVSGMLKNIAKWESTISTDAADVDKNEKLNLADVSKMLKKLAKWDDISLGNVRMVFENKKVVAEHEDSTLGITFVDMMYKHGREVADYEFAYGDYAKDAFKMKLAKNESESCQAILMSENDREGLSAELTPFVSEFGDATIEGKLEWVNYYDHSLAWPIIKSDRTRETGKWENTDEFISWYGADLPEVLLDMADTFEMKASKLQHLVITVTSAKDTPAGMYTANLNIKDGDKVIKTGKIYAYVWDFALPDAPYSASLFANAEYVRNADGTTDMIDYYNMMLDNNLSSYVLPYDITDERADAYMSDPRVTAFTIAGGTTGPNGEYGTSMYGGRMNCSPAETVANYNKVAANPEWFKKGLFYYTDEPWGPHLDNLIATYNYVTDLLGTTNIRNMTPLAGNDGYGNEYCTNNGVDPVAYIDPYINVWCPQSNAYHRWTDGGKWGLRRFVNKYGEYADRIEVFKENGDEAWWYVCCSPEIPYANYFTWYQGAVVRVLSWQQFMNDVDGVLYYGIGVHWNKISKYQFEIYNGDGVLAFPGEFWGRVGPSPSWRLYQIRDGFDDFDYLRIAEELVGREAVMKVVSKVTTGMLRYTEDYEVIEACRDELVNMILEAQAK